MFYNVRFKVKAIDQNSADILKTSFQNKFNLFEADKVSQPYGDGVCSANYCPPEGYIVEGKIGTITDKSIPIKNEIIAVCDSAPNLLAESAPILLKHQCLHDETNLTSCNEVIF